MATDSCFAVPRPPNSRHRDAQFFDLPKLASGDWIGFADPWADTRRQPIASDRPPERPLGPRSAGAGLRFVLDPVDVETG
jgi:hypothetical protein